MNKKNLDVRRVGQVRRGNNLAIKKKMILFAPKWRIPIAAFVIVTVTAFLFYKLFLETKWTELNYKWGIDNLSEGNFEQAAKNFEKASGDEENSDALFKLAVSKYNQKDFEGAIALYEKIIAKEPGNVLAYNGLANLYRDQKNYTLAKENYYKAFAAKPTYAVAYSNLGIMLMDTGEKDEAKKVVDDGLNKNPNSIELKNLKNILEQ